MEPVPYVLVGAFVLGMLVVAITRRGKNLVEALPVIPGEALIEERAVRHSSFPRRAITASRSPNARPSRP